MNEPAHKVGQQTERPWWHKVWHGAAGWTVKDARGRRVQLFANLVPGSVMRKRLGITHSEIRTLRRSLRGSRALGAVAGFFLMYFGFGWILMLIMISISGGTDYFDSYRSLWLVVTGLAASAMYWWGLGSSRSRLRVAMQSLSRCASCGYSLKGIHADADGCTVCPECGAAWRLTKESPK